MLYKAFDDAKNMKAIQDWSKSRSRIQEKRLTISPLYVKRIP